MPVISKAMRTVSKLPQNKWFAQWQLADTSIVEVEITQAEYQALAVSGAPANITGDPNAVWKMAYETWMFDNGKKDLDPGDVTDAWAGFVTLQVGTVKVRFPVDIVPGGNFTAKVAALQGFLVLP